MSDDGGWFDWGGEGGEGGGGGGGDWSDSIADGVVKLVFWGCVVATPFVAIGALFSGSGGGGAPIASGTRPSGGSTAARPSAGDILDTMDGLPSTTPSEGGGRYGRDDRHQASPPDRAPQQERPAFTDRYCTDLVRRARATYGPGWESFFSYEEARGCRRQIADARRSSQETQRQPPPRQRPPQRIEQPPPPSRGFDAERKQVGVPYDDLDLSTQGGAREMLARIKSAASRACGGRPDTRDTSEARRYRQCVRDAVARTVADLDAPLVTAAHRSESG
jgi:UrcA family protein